ncbi:proprotein convertase P-domain-containing protein [Herbihabitans rhizosphaerae]|uniref:Proprotein convertase P-domain-containing protein n=1 Tax=Herbihabitans rhizosphaerae TaxID=1872711 RepID=A0A4Q7KRG1_9PSEU|nr:S8 family serine peptidase [Herbihabitans rhizosphaerae]RZS39057.1 proprotein convertase P-domain-containing protein [Herbihabitans rhizosphaerae]
MRLRRPVVAVAAALLTAVGLASPATAAPSAPPLSPQDNAFRQIEALQKIKASAKEESKVDSRITVERARQERSAALPRLAPAALVSPASTVTVDIRTTSVSPDLIAQLTRSGAGVRAVSHRYDSVRAEVPLTAVTALAARPDVKAVEVAGEAITARANPRQRKPESKQDKANRIAENTRRALTDRAAPIISEGDRAHNADTARQQFGVTGVGVKICALSDGVDSLSTSQAAGELGPVDVLPGQAGDGDEGTAMLEIIHDVAPGADLGYATAFTSDASFADNIRALRFQAGCDVIVDDVLYFKESPFQDWIIAQAVNDVTTAGALYFSSAGNEGNTVDGTAGHWEGDYVNSGQVIGKWAGHAHDFDPGPGTQIFQPLSAESRGVPVTLHWSDPIGASGNDYDLYLLNAAGDVIAASQDYQDGTQDPYERLNTPTALMPGLRLAVVKFAGADRYVSLSALRGRFTDSTDGLKAFSTPGVTLGHSAARKAFSVAAAPANLPLPFDLEPGDPPNPRGPFPGAYDAASSLERFTSDGPRRVFYEADGTPITPGDVGSTGGEVRQKPDITAADGVRTSVQDFDPFFGTSASAPHAAAIAGLVLSGNPGLPDSEVREALINTAIDLGAPGVDNRAGAGMIMVDRVLAYTGASPQPRARAANPTIRANDGGAYLDPGDTATITLPVTNSGDAPAVSTSVVLTSPTPGVTIAPRSKSYGTVDRGQTVVNTFQLTIPASHPVGLPVRIDTRVTFAGALSPTTVTFTAEVGQSSPVVNHFAYAGAPVAIPDDSPLGATVPITVSGVGRASKLAFSVDGQTCSATAGSTTVGIDHTWVADMVGTLTSPSGASAVVFAGGGGGGNNMCQVVFDDTAARAFASAFSAEAPFTGTWRPDQALDRLRADAVDGTWTFTVIDTVADDTGTVRAVSLHANGYVTPTGP